MTMIVVPRDHDLRRPVEEFISETYRQCYQARIPAFPPVLLALCTSDGRIQCASGLRFSDDGFFSECYLDIPIEVALQGFSYGDVARNDIFEVTSLASRAPNSAARFLRRIVAYGDLAGFSWAFFTATDRLRQLLNRIELPLAQLGPANRTRAKNPDIWGGYYDSDPHVCAVNRIAAAAFLDKSKTRHDVHA